MKKINDFTKFLYFQYILLATCHIHWDPEFCDVKLIQVKSKFHNLKVSVISRNFLISDHDVSRSTEKTYQKTTPKYSFSPIVTMWRFQFPTRFRYNLTTMNYYLPFKKCLNSEFVKISELLFGNLRLFSHT